MNRKWLLSVLLFLFFLCLPVVAVCSTSALVNTPAAVQTESKQQEKAPVEKVAPAVSFQTVPSRQSGSFERQWLHMLDKQESKELGNSGIIAFAPQVPFDLARIFGMTENGGHKTRLFSLLWRTAVAIAFGFVLLALVRRLTRQTVLRLEQTQPENNGGASCLWAGVLRSLPTIGGLFILVFGAMLAFMALAEDILIQGRMIFQLILGIFFFSMLSSKVSRIIFAPTEPTIRPLALGDDLAKPLHHAFTTSAAVILSGRLFMHFMKELGAKSQTISWVFLILGSLVIAVFAGLVIYLRRPVSASLEEKIQGNKSSWLDRQIAAYWHVGSLLYFAIMWFFWVGRVLTETNVGKGGFIIGLLIVPIYLILSFAGKLIIEAVIDSLGLDQVPPRFDLSDEEHEQEKLKVAERKQEVISTTVTFYKFLLVGSLLTWLLALWGYHIPFAAIAVRAIFQSLVALSLALLVWRFISTYIEKKLAEVAPETPEKEEDVDDEFGSAAPRGRSSTLLPMLRKVLGSILVVMVILIILSSLGVNIGPILAGAGVIGLAVGFGAQKLVSDILSGFFFLLDDAFRVGEYIQTGSIRGTVETITLRNVMLRHHLGMLQVVPHSDLGAVTNYMRGGIVIKFPLEFPYDTDINKVRKTIKKVGQEMLTDEEIGEDFIQPLKSQGVYEITNSVMVIRVKFTAKPGKQFVIKREAFRRITEALNARGIHYAHRKVIVDFPTDDRKEDMSPATRQKVLEAGAAAAITLQEDQSREEAAKTKKE